MVKTVFESDASLSNYREKRDEIRVDACMSACVSSRQSVPGGTASSRRDFYVELVLIYSTIGLYASSQQKRLHAV
jgi:hypothetical protein